jgi:NADPH2:quinone reductase
MSIPTTQRAVQINRTGGPEVIEINTAAPVPTPNDNEILVNNQFAGLNYIDTVRYPYLSSTSVSACKNCS